MTAPTAMNPVRNPATGFAPTSTSTPMAIGASGPASVIKVGDAEHGAALPNRCHLGDHDGPENEDHVADR